MSSEKRCNQPFPENSEVRCRKTNDHDGNHQAEAEVVDKKKEKWDKVRWEWNSERIIQKPSDVGTGKSGIGPWG